MKEKLLSLIIIALVMTLWSCNDQCKETRVTRRYTPVTHSLTDLRSQVRAENARELDRPGKIYVKGSYLFINEIKKGIHVIDNSDPANPRFISFINIPGNGDIAVRDQILFADSFSDLVALDISDPENARETGRVKDVFKYGNFDGGGWSLSASGNTIQEAAVSFVTETITTSCDDFPKWNGMLPSSDQLSSGVPNSSSAPGGSNGKAGSMARFALHQDYLYAIGFNNLQLFNINNPAQPKEKGMIPVGWGIETIFPYQDKLFLGSSTGMFIYDNSNPAEPKRLSVFEHGRACDPVVVHDDVAYVTLRTGNTCAGGQNQLDLVDVSNASNPQLIKSYPMQNPHGLSIDFPTLYLCEGTHGLKVFDVKDRFAIDKNKISHFQGMDAYDVISLEKTLLMIGKDGFYQYDASNPNDLKLLSKIAVNKPAEYGL
ncbi:MAG TPA: hypothetical protein VGN64_08985 [Dyadobacter sp.]|nr:hypothetical protein [Dyadobacter sp.]